tara:strand:- start:472 stop:924 length:453 start_codon:yes stop_codon:yes gene_type:complete
MALYGPLDDDMKTSMNSTTSNRSLSGSTTSWTSHVTVTITSTIKGPVTVHGYMAGGYESGAVNLQARVNIEQTGGTNYYSDAMTVGIQMNSNRLQHSSGAMSWTFPDIVAGTHVCRLQLRNMGSSSTFIASYFSPGGTETLDHIQAFYRG